jgi:hypothetical protein
MVIQQALGGSSISLRWGFEGDANMGVPYFDTTYGGLTNQEAYMTSSYIPSGGPTPYSTYGGVAFPAYSIIKDIHVTFPAGTPLVATTAIGHTSGTTDYRIDVLASANNALILNKTNGNLIVYVTTLTNNGTNTYQTYTIAAYSHIVI